MPVLGQIVTYITALGDPRAAIVTMTPTSTTITLSAFLVVGDDDFSKGPIVTYTNVAQDATGQPGTWH